MTASTPVMVGRDPQSSGRATITLRPGCDWRSHDVNARASGTKGSITTVSIESLCSAISLPALGTSFAGIALYPAASSVWPKQKMKPKSESTRRIVPVSLPGIGSPAQPLRNPQRLEQVWSQAPRMIVQFKTKVFAILWPHDILLKTEGYGSCRISHCKVMTCRAFLLFGIFGYSSVLRKANQATLAAAPAEAATSAEAGFASIPSFFILYSSAL